MLWSYVKRQAKLIVMNGGFFFLGLFLGTLFLMAAVLIIYYKQVSEGYEDRERYRIMLRRLLEPLCIVGYHLRNLLSCPKTLYLRPGTVQRRSAQSRQFTGQYSENASSRQDHTLRKQ